MRNLYLRGGGVSLVLDFAGSGLPQVVYRGADLGDLVAASVPQRVSNAVDHVVPVSVLPDQSTGRGGTAAPGSPAGYSARSASRRPPWPRNAWS